MDDGDETAPVDRLRGVYSMDIELQHGDEGALDVSLEPGPGAVADV